MIARKENTVITVECYPGVDIERLTEDFLPLFPVKVIQSDSCLHERESINQLIVNDLTDDRVFGKITNRTIEECFDQMKIQNVRKQIENIQGIVIVIGTGASFITKGDVLIYADISRWEIQLRYRAGMSNWLCHNPKAPILEKYKCGFFIEWRMADKLKKQLLPCTDYMMDCNIKEKPILVAGKQFREGMKRFSNEPFRTVPYFDPGVWGGQWMKNHFSLPADRSNFAWSFDGVPEENGIRMCFGDITAEFPAQNLVLLHPKDLMGSRVYARFGTEFPIRFDLLDTVEGGNLSLQVHPLTEYIQEHFNMKYTQDESYYILDAQKDSHVYLGVKENADQEQFADDLKQAEKGEKEFPAEKYVNCIPVKKHDHILIPAGTIHCSGKNTMVLEISATPYIFTFKLWDWGRVGLDGLPRPVHIDHGLRNIQWDRDTKWIENNLIHREKTLMKDERNQIEKTGLHELEFIETRRYTINYSLQCVTDDSVHVLNLVEGEEIEVASPTNQFSPLRVHYAETFFIPASAEEYILRPAGKSLGKTVMVVDAFIK
ncbi:class I mannose-6-phosphate isomerase [Massiliimalia timonensis]|uniref:class I mannose-6-phosphate isomerase n=1 Tax=Massiliimalia timonensis TaxID=1987501 RepID=UPI002D21AF9A|nr:class I mannose-6-phosphate isomerase [Massiliimalia timonensis]